MRAKFFFVACLVSFSLSSAASSSAIPFEHLYNAEFVNHAGKVINFLATGFANDRDEEAQLARDGFLLSLELKRLKSLTSKNKYMKRSYRQLLFKESISEQDRLWIIAFSAWRLNRTQAEYIKSNDPESNDAVNFRVGGDFDVLSEDELSQAENIVDDAESDDTLDFEMVENFDAADDEPVSFSKTFSSMDRIPEAFFIKKEHINFAEDLVTLHINKQTLHSPSFASHPLFRLAKTNPTVSLWHLIKGPQFKELRTDLLRLGAKQVKIASPARKQSLKAIFARFLRNKNSLPKTKKLKPKSNFYKISKEQRESAED